MQATSVDYRLLRSGRIVGSLVLSIVFLVLVPTWLLGNLFVAAFPPAKNVANSAAAKSKANNSAPSTTQPQPSSGEHPVSGSEASELNPANTSPSDSLAASPKATVAAAQPMPRTDVQSNAQAETHAIPTPDFREWTNAQGKKVEAKFVRFVDDKIELTTSNGKLFLVSPAIFSSADQDYLKQFQQ